MFAADGGDDGVSTQRVSGVLKVGYNGRLTPAGRHLGRASGLQE